MKILKFVTKEQTAETLFETAFKGPREPRSGSYRTGVKAGIYAGLKIARPLNPYPPGSPESDAWLSGVEEGRNIVRRR